MRKVLRPLEHARTASDGILEAESSRPGHRLNVGPRLKSFRLLLNHRLLSPLSLEVGADTFRSGQISSPFGMVHVANESIARAVKAVRPARAIPERLDRLHRKRMTPLNEGSRPTAGASSITSDGGEANPIILAEQPGDDARAGTVSTQAMLAALRDADHTAKERENARLKIQ